MGIRDAFTMEKKGKGGFWDHFRIIFGLHENVPFLDGIMVGRGGNNI